MSWRGGAAQLTGGAKTKRSLPDTEFDAGYFREGEDRLFKSGVFWEGVISPVLRGIRRA